MRTSFLLVSSFLFLEFIVLISHSNSGVDAIPIPISTAFAILTAIVKLKVILVKMFLGLQHMGFIRNKRSLDDQDEIRESWSELQKAAERNISFDLESCNLAVKFNKSETPMWTKIIELELKKENDTENYSRHVSSLIGSMTGDLRACQLLKKEVMGVGNE